MSDRVAVAVAAAVALGASVGDGPTPIVGALLALVAVAARRPWLLCLAAALAAAGLAEGAYAGLDPVAAGPFDGWVTLVGDPEPLDGSGVAVVVAYDGRRVEALAHGPPAWALEPRLAGERVLLQGRLRPPPLPLSSWRVQRRIVGRLDVESVVDVAGGSPLAGGANALRRTIDGGAADLSDRSRSLLNGVVLGDDRHQPPELADDFEAAGLTHLLAVSGQNVAFLLALSRPMLSWLPGRARLLGTLAVLGAFAMLVRFEPSVMRAGAMAAVACIAATMGRPAERIRILAIAVAVLLLVDPLLVRSVGFGLSVGASLGIVVLAPRLATAIPGPRPLAEALAVTLAAQAGALPVLLPAFGAVPVATVPANLLAVPAAGPLMTWGLTGGVAAGVLDGPAAGALHVPTRALTWWLATVADRAARLPLGELTPAHLVALAGFAGAALAARWAGVLCRWRWAAAAVAGAVVGSAAIAAPAVPEGRDVVVAGVSTERRGSVVVAVIDDGARPRDTLEGLRRGGARCVDAVVVAPGAGPAARAAAAALGRRCRGVPVVAAEGSALPGWRVLPAGSALAIGDLVVVADGAGRLRVRPAARAPPAAMPRCLGERTAGAGAAAVRRPRQARHRCCAGRPDRRRGLARRRRGHGPARS